MPVATNGMPSAPRALCSVFASNAYTHLSEQFPSGVVVINRCTSEIASASTRGAAGTAEDPMQSKTPAQNGGATRQSEGRELAEGEPSTTRANDVMTTAQRSDRLALLPLKLLRFTDVRERTGLSRSTVWRLERRGAFPKHIKVSTNIVAWLEEDVIEWIRSKAKGLVA